jgi:hypothetical protein
MKKIISFAFALAVTLSAVFAQNTYTAKKDMTLAFKGDEGTNACAVVWNPDKKVYYAVIAGNATYPLETFSQSGNVQYTGTAGVDTRGLWYNAKTTTLEGNGAGEVGYFTFKTNASGEPRDPEVVLAGQHQPDFQSVGAFNSKKQLIYYFFEGSIKSYKRKSGSASKSIELKNCPVGTSDLNYTTVVFTERKGEELGLLDYNANRVYLFNLKGVYTATVNLPSTAIAGDAFRFSFANGKIWLYDVDSRSWTAYTF